MIILFFVTIGLFVQGIMLDIALRADITGWLERAGQATTAEAMASYIDKALEGLDKWGMYEGTWEWLYINPNNFMEVSRELLSDLRDRCLEIERTMPRGSMDYAESLEEIKRTFNTIAINPWAWYALRHYPWLYYWGAWFIAWIFSVILSMADERDFRCTLGFHDWREYRKHDPKTGKSYVAYYECERWDCRALRGKKK